METKKRYYRELFEVSVEAARAKIVEIFVADVMTNKACVDRANERIDELQRDLDKRDLAIGELMTKLDATTEKLNKVADFVRDLAKKVKSTELMPLPTKAPVTSEAVITSH